MTVKELKEELEYYDDDDMEVTFEVCDTFEPDSITEDKWGNREVYLDAKVQPYSISEAFGNVCIQLARVRW